MTPRIVTTVEELPIAQMYESGQVAMAVHDANGQPWVLWESERGDVVARSYLTDDEQYACEDAEGLAWPLTVLTPAPAPVDREALVERVLDAFAEDGLLCSCAHDDPSDAMVEANAHIVARAALKAVTQ